MTTLAQALSVALLHFVWQGLVVGILLWATLFLLRKRAANSRYLASCAALAALAALPAITTWVLYERSAPPAGFVTMAAQPAPGLAGTPRGIPARAASWLARAEAWTLPVWSLGVLLLSLRLVWSAGQVTALRRRGVAAGAEVCAAAAALAARLGVRRTVQLRISEAAESPSVIGWLRPVILLPSATLLGLTPQQLEAVLAHEMAHIRRFDYPVNLLQMLIETLLFYHPVVWLVSARMRHERELCCDDLAVASCGDALCYARALTRLERLRITAPAVAMAATAGPMLYRVQRIVGAAGAEYRPSRLPAILAVCLGLSCLALNVHWAKAQDQTPQQQAQQQKPASVTINKEGQSVTVTLRNGVEEPKPGQPVTFWMAADQGNIATATFNPREGRTGERGIKVDTGGAAVLHREPVEYPRAAIEKGIQGTVTVEAILDASGEVTDAHVLSGPQELRKAALQSVLEWGFQGGPAGSSRQVSIEFQIPPEGAQKEPLHEFRVLLNAANGNNQVAERRADVQKLESEMDEFKAQYKGKLQPGASPELEARYAEMAAKLDAARYGLKEAQDRATGVVPVRPSVVGHIVKIINVNIPSDTQRASLSARLGIHVGDTLTGEAMEDLTKTLREIDQHLHAGYTLTQDGQVEIRIMGPGKAFFFGKDQ